MARISEDLGVKGFNVSSSTDLATGVTSTTSTLTAYPMTYYHLDRSDVVKTHKDASGWRFPTPYVVSLSSWKQPMGGYEYTAGGVKYKRFGPEWPEIKLAATLPVFPAGLRSRAEVNALTKLKEAKVNLPQAFFERHQTISLVTSNVKRIHSVWDEMKREILGSKKYRKMSPAMLSDLWLEYAYGWRPAIDDIYGACQVLDAAEQREGPRRHRISVTGRVREDSKVITPRIDGPNGIWRSVRTIRTMQGCYVSLYYEPNTAAPLQSLAQAGAINPLLLAWELLPYSFVCDWVLPVGKWLNTLDANIGWKFLSGSRTQVTRVRQREDYYAGYGPYKPRNVTGTHLAQRYSLNRFVYSSSPIATFPRLKDPRGLEHMNNAIALLLSAMKGGHRVTQ